MNKIFIFFIVILAVAIVIPQIALAAWWNPFSWGVWNRVFHFQKIEQKQEQEQNNSSVNYLEIKEVGLKFKITDDIKDLVYEIKTESNGSKFVSFTTKSLENTNIKQCKAKNAPLGSLGIYREKLTGEIAINYLIESDNLYVEYMPSQGPCSDTKTIQDLQTKQSKSLQQALKTIVRTSVTTDQTSNWKTYTNTEYGFKFKYPDDWKIDDNLTAKTCCLDLVNTFSTSEIGISKGVIKMQFQNYRQPKGMTLKNYVEGLTYMESATKDSLVKEVVTAGINGFFSNLIGDGTYYIPKSSTEGISVTIFNHPESREKFKNTIEQILSTFKFTK